MTAEAEFELRRLREQIDAILALGRLPDCFMNLQKVEPWRLPEEFDYQIGDFLIKVVKKEITRPQRVR